jgi:K+-transporting ATPase ATPase C chain
MKSLILPSIRLLIVTQLICVVAYLSVMLTFAKVTTPDTALASIVKDTEGRAVGSRQVAQNFTKPEYFWPRPSAVDYNGAGAGGSNKSPTSPELTERAAKIIARHGATPARPLPPDLAAASGSGLDPFITEAAARFQLPRVAGARGLEPNKIEPLLSAASTTPGGFLTGSRIVNVLELNLALDALK